MNLQTQLYMNDRIFPIGIKVVTLHKYIYIYLFDLGDQVIVRKRAARNYSRQHVKVV